MKNMRDQMASPPGVIRESELVGAIARGWCHPNTSDREMDIDLALAIKAEVIDLLLGFGVCVTQAG